MQESRLKVSYSPCWNIFVCLNIFICLISPECLTLGARNFLKKVCLYTGFEVTKNCLDTKLIEDMEQNLSQSFSYFENLFDEVTALKRPEFCGA